MKQETSVFYHNTGVWEMNTQTIGSQYSHFLIHNSWSSLMKLHSLWTGVAVLGAMLIFSTQAFAQLPVRTRSLQLNGATSGYFQQTAPAATTTYSLEWPASTGITAGSSGYLRVTESSGNFTSQWVEISTSLVDGAGAAGQVAYWSDPNTLTGDADFTFDGTNVTVGTSGTGVVIGSDGTVNMGGVVLTPGTTDYTLTFDNATAAGSYYVTPSTNQAGAGTANYIYVSNGDGTGSWVASPTTNLEFGRTAGNGTYTQTITPTSMSATATVLVTWTGLSANIIQVTSQTATSFTVESTAPLDNTGFINWQVNF